jgi:RNA recognition motif-containing protein
MRSLVGIRNLKLSVTAEEIGREFSKYGRVSSSVTEWREGWLFLDGRVEVECERGSFDVGRMKEICLFEGTRIEICEKKDKKEKLVEERLEKYERRESSFILSVYLFVFKLFVFFHFVCE